MTQHLSLLLLFAPIVVLGQPRLNEKFVNDAINENNYIVFNSDSTFSYRLAYHLFHDISCGYYKTNKDTIILLYKTDLRDTTCNKEVDAAAHFDSNLFSLRPNKLFYKDDKLYRIEKGKIIDRTEEFKPGWKIPKDSRKYYQRKYFLFGPLIRKSKNTYYMVVASKAKWTKASR